MGIIDFPEINFARRIKEKHNLTVPFDIKAIVNQYADLIYKEIPFSSVDGVSININVPGKRPKIIVNSNSPKTRQLFTLAHELGHVIIPWHQGTIIDDIYPVEVNDLFYLEQEQEANRFAAELLMPSEWILNQYSDYLNDIGSLQLYISHIVGVSFLAISIKLKDTLPKNIVFVFENNGIVINSGVTKNSDITAPLKGERFRTDFYKNIESYSVLKSQNGNFHWFKINDKMEIKSSSDIRTWREILDDIVSEIKPEKEQKKYKQSINGIIAHAKGKLKLQNNCNVASLTAKCLNRFDSKEYNNLVEHKYFNDFLFKKLKDLLEE